MFPVLSSEYILVSLITAACLTDCKYFDLTTIEMQRKVYKITSYPVMQDFLLRFLSQIFLTLLCILAFHVFSLKLNYDYSHPHCSFFGFSRVPVDFPNVQWIS
jgi:hypothetical protein